MWVIAEKKRRLQWSWHNAGEKYPVRETLHLKVMIDEVRRHSVTQSFGFPETWLRKIENTEDEWELAKKLVAFRSKLEDRGMKYSIIENSLEINYQWMIDRSRDDLRQLTHDLLKLGKSKMLKTQRDYIRLLASFVQHMRYVRPGIVDVRPESGRIVIRDIWMPLESLYRGCGDCDTKSVLFASMMANVPGTHVLFMLGEGHAFVGVRGVPRRGDRFVNLRGAKYILVELTYPWPVGQIPTEYWHHTQRGALELVKVVGDGK